MTSKDGEALDLAQRIASDPSDEKTPKIQYGEAEDAAIIAALQGYVPDTVEEKRLVRKIDFILLPILWWMYILAHLDRSNIANANAAGMSEELGLSDNRAFSNTDHTTLSEVKKLTVCRIRNASIAFLCGLRHL